MSGQVPGSMSRGSAWLTWQHEVASGGTSGPNVALGGLPLHGHAQLTHRGTSGHALHLPWPFPLPLHLLHLLLQRLLQMNLMLQPLHVLLPLLLLLLVLLLLLLLWTGL